MSLINQMLKDLEERKKVEADAPPSLLDGVEVESSQLQVDSVSRRPLLLLMAVVLLVGGGVLGWQYLNPEGSQVIVPAAAPVKIPVASTTVDLAADLAIQPEVSAEPLASVEPVRSAPMTLSDSDTPDTVISEPVEETVEIAPQPVVVTQAQPQQPVAPAVSASAPLPTATTNPSGPLLQAWQATEKGRLLSISLDFDKAPAYRIWRQRQSGNLIVDLQGVQLAKGIDLSAGGSALLGVDSRQEGNKLRLTLRIQGDYREFYRDFALSADAAGTHRLLVELYRDLDTVKAPSVTPQLKVVEKEAEKSHPAAGKVEPLAAKVEARPVKQFGSNGAMAAESLEKVASQPSQDVTPQTIARLRDAWAAGDLNSAEKALRQGLIEQPEAHEIRDELVRLLWRSGRISEAEVLLQQGLAQDPQRLSYRTGLARLLVERGAAAQARTLLDAVPEPALAAGSDFFTLSAAVDQRLGAYDRAAATYRRLLSLDQGNGTWWVGLGIALESSGQSEAAAAVWPKALQTRLPAEMDRFVRAKLGQ